MRCSCLAPAICAVMAVAGCDFGRVSDITEPTPIYNPPPPPPPPVRPPITSIAFGDVIRFGFTTEGFECGAGRCLSYYVTPQSDGTMDVVIKPTMPNDVFFPGLELYIVPGADGWNVGEGPQISAAAIVKAGQRYEIRMGIRAAPTAEFELRTSLR
jgi:hypothetical protein